MRSQEAAAPRAVSVEALYRQYGPLIFSRCRRLLRDEEAAQDATQEVFLRVMKHLDRAPVNGNLAGWLSRISINYCLNLLRDGRKVEPSGDAPERAGANLEERLVCRDLANRLLEKTPPPLRDLVVLHHLEGFKHGQVAQTLGVSRRTILYRLDRFGELAERFRAKVAKEAA